MPQVLNTAPMRWCHFSSELLRPMCKWEGGKGEKETGEREKEGQEERGEGGWEEDEEEASREILVL